jgi:predicted dehydrogenase
VSTLRLAIIGGGHLGKIHSRLAANLPDTKLVAVVEPDPDAAAAIAGETGCRTVPDLTGVENDIDAAIIASPTHTHFQIADRLLRRNIHLLIEKPVTTTAPQADRLIDLADQNQLVLQVGHVERFNPAFELALATLPAARYIESNRLSRYTFRSTDIGVVHDLMIHDIDLICAVVDSNLIETRAVGISVFGPHEDIAQARLEFADGTVANLSASRCSFETTRKISWFAEGGYVAADLAAGSVRSAGVSAMINRDARRDVAGLSADQKHLVRESLFESVLPMQTHTVAPQNAIQNEQMDFVNCIRNGEQPRVCGRAGRRAVAIAQCILDSISRHQWLDGQASRVGHQALPLNLQPVQSRPALARLRVA